MGDFHAQDLANTVLAFATLGQSDVNLFAAMGRAATWCIGDFNVQGLANTAWAFATAGQLDASLFAALARVPPFIGAWATFPCPRLPQVPHPFFFGHVFQTFFKIGF